MSWSLIFAISFVVCLIGWVIATIVETGREAHQRRVNERLRRWTR